MGADTYRLAVAAAEWTGRGLTDDQLEAMATLHGVLAKEAIVAGGLGPHEAPRLWGRHIADSLLFGVALDGAVSCIDVGSGVGLPGIPLAIAYPEIEFELVDRSGRRCDLIRRIIAVLRLGNCAVVHKDVSSVDKNYDALVSRASLPPDRLMIHVKRLLRKPGVAVIGLSRNADQPVEVPVSEPGLRSHLVRVPTDVLDSSVNLLRIEAT